MPLGCLLASGAGSLIATSPEGKGALKEMFNRHFPEDVLGRRRAADGGSEGKRRSCADAAAVTRAAGARRRAGCLLRRRGSAAPCPALPRRWARWSTCQAGLRKGFAFWPGTRPTRRESLGPAQPSAGGCTDGSPLQSPESHLLTEAN